MYENQFKRAFLKPLMNNTLNSKKKPLWSFLPLNRGHKGIPDILFLWGGQLYAMEIKMATKYKISSQQVLNLLSIAESGGYAMLVFVNEKKGKIKIHKEIEKFISDEYVIKAKKFNIHFMLFRTKASARIFNKTMTKLQKGASEWMHTGTKIPL